MDFLRRLSPAYQAGPSRAVPVLPSRFAAVEPLSVAAERGEGDREESMRQADDISMELPFPPSSRGRFSNEPSNAFESQPVPGSRAVRTNSTQPQHPSTNASPPGKSLAAGELREPIARSVTGRTVAERAATDRTSPATPARHEASPLSSEGGPEGLSHAVPAKAAPTAAPAALNNPRNLVSPLSDAALAQRRSDSSRDSIDHPPVVHVTIGRVELVANVPPADAKRTPAPRPASVPLSDYLRGSNNASTRSGKPG